MQNQDAVTRPSWDEWGLGLARAVATRADCVRRQVGAVLLDQEHRVVATGYNGAPSGNPGCLTSGACPRGQTSMRTWKCPEHGGAHVHRLPDGLYARCGACGRDDDSDPIPVVEPGSSYDSGAGLCIAVHAEQNALLRASWADMVGSTLYVTDEPCVGCWRTIRATPVARVMYPGTTWEKEAGK